MSESVHRRREAALSRVATRSSMGVALLALAACAISHAESPSSVERFIAAAESDTAAWSRLAELTDRFGNRFSGSPSLEEAIDWIVLQMRADGLENVHTEPVMVPHWVRGAESATLVSPRRAPLPMLGLGRSVGTPVGGITAPVL